MCRKQQKDAGVMRTTAVNEDEKARRRSMKEGDGLKVVVTLKRYGDYRQ